MNLPLPEAFCIRDELIDAAADVDPDDAEIIGVIAETFDLTEAEAVERLARIDFNQARSANGR